MDGWVWHVIVLCVACRTIRIRICTKRQAATTTDGQRDTLTLTYDITYNSIRFHRVHGIVILLHVAHSVPHLLANEVGRRKMENKRHTLRTYSNLENQIKSMCLACYSFFPSFIFSVRCFVDILSFGFHCQCVTVVWRGNVSTTELYENQQKNAYTQTDPCISDTHAFSCISFGSNLSKWIVCVFRQSHLFYKNKTRLRHDFNRLSNADESTIKDHSPRHFSVFFNISI